jgi:Toastrack DUF4097
MKNCGIILLTLITVAAIPARAEQWSKTYNISGTPDLRVETSDANIRVDTWDQKTIEATVTSTRDKIGKEIEEHQNGDVVEIKVRYPHHGITINIGNQRVDITIHMPRQGKVYLQTGDGKIDLSSFQGEMELRSGDGSQTVQGCDGKLFATTGDGRITADGHFGELNLKSGDGRVEVRADAGSTIASEWRLETGDGNVSLGLPGDLAADVDLHTGDGHIELDMPVSTEGRLKGNEVHGKLNGGGKLITIQTGDGSIRLFKD